MEETLNYQLKKPSYNDFGDIEVINENMDEIDRILKLLAEAAASAGVTVEDLLTSDSADNALSAKQGKVLKALIDAKASSENLMELINIVTQHLAQDNTNAHTVDNISGLNDRLNNITVDTTSIQSNVIDLALELELMKDSEITGVNSNIFIETFQDVNDLLVLNGAYNNIGKCLEV